MFGIYLRRELSNRRRQTIVIAIGMALAIALVIVVNAVAAGVRTAQSTALQSVYGVGTDITVTEASTAATDGGRQRFGFGAGAGSTNGGTRTINRSRLSTSPGTTTFAATDVTKAKATTGVKAATGVLALNNTTFSGTLPTQRTQGGFGGQGSSGTRPTGGTDGAGGSSFGITSVSVLGYDPAATAIGPLTAATLAKGRVLAAGDAGKDVALLDSDYATTAKKAVGGTITLGGKSFTIVGIVKSTSTSGSSAANAYIPLSTAQTLATQTGKISSVYVQATSANDIDAVQTALKSSLGSSVTVNTQADLASNVSGSLATTASLANSLGLWLSILVLAAAFLIAVLFTISGVTRRTREFGTLKAIGWSDRRIVGQVVGESFVQGIIGGVIGIVIGIAAILVVNVIHPTLTASTAVASRFAGGGAGSAGGAAGGGFGGSTDEGLRGGFGAAARQATATASDIALHLPIPLSIIGVAVALAVLGGLIAGAFGGWRASRLRPAEALRSVA